MAAITKSVNGVVATITPAVFQTLGPSGQNIEFTSRPGTGASTPISIEFDRPISQFSISIVGLTFGPHITRIFNTNGVVIQSISTNTGSPDQGIGGGVESVDWGSVDQSAIRVELIPPAADYVGYVGLSVQPEVRIAPSQPVPTPTLTPTRPVQEPPIVSPTFTPPQASPPAPTVAPVRYINLAEVVILDAVVIDRQYIKGSLRNIQSAKFNVKNISSEVEVQVALGGLAGVSFDPANFTLTKNGSQEVTVNFDVATIDNLPEGINTVNAAINLNSNTAVFDPLPPPPAPVPPPPPTPVPAPVPPPIPVLPPVEIAPPPSTAEIPVVQIRNNDDFIVDPIPVTTVTPPVVTPPGPPPPPVTITPAPPPVLNPWVNGLNGQLNYGNPPDGWVQDPFGGTWYPPNDPFVLRDFDRAARPTTIVSAIDGSRGTFDPNAQAIPVIQPTPILIAPRPVEELPPPPPPPPPPPWLSFPPPPPPPPKTTFTKGRALFGNT